MNGSMPEPGVPVDASYLREQAQRCVRIARECPHRPTSHQLESIGVELMEKASEIDKLISDLAASGDDSRGCKT